MKKKSLILPTGVQQSLFGNFDPFDEIQRSQLIADHPLMLSESGYTFATSAVQRALTQLVSAVSSGLPGIAFIAYPRFGKTAATRYLKKVLSTTFDDIPVVTFIAKYHAIPNELRFYKELLSASKLAHPIGRDPADYLDRLWKSWWTRVVTSHSKRIILIIDEAQKLNSANFSWLIDLSNSLGEHQVSLTVVLFGQPELVNQRQVFLYSNRNDIICRFMVDVHNFEGIRNALELSEVLGFYDDQVISEYPTDSQCSCTQFFVPQAYKNGWRLMPLSNKLWKAFEMVASSTGEKSIENGLNIGMNWIKIAVQNILIELMPDDTPSMKSSDEILLHAVKRSGFAESLGIIRSNSRKAVDV